MSAMNISVLEKTYAIYSFSSESDLPEWIYSSDFYSITKTEDEVSLVAVQSGFIPEGLMRNSDWRILKVEGPLEFSLVGIIAEITSILANELISVFTISTYNTDYILVKQKDLDRSIAALNDKGYQFPEKKEN